MTQADAPLARDNAPARWRAYGELAKPGVTQLVIVTTFAGALVAPGAVRWGRLALAVTGTTLVVAAANALNMAFERDTDALMERTRSRPIPSGRLSVEAAVLFGLVVGAMGLLLLGVWVSALVTVLALVALGSYVLVYTPLKRVTPWALHVGAVPGALPPVIGWAAMADRLGPQAFALFAILFAWQLPHFLAIALFRAPEYERAGLQVLPVARGVTRTKAELIVYAVLLVAASLFPATLGMGGAAYLTFALACGLVFFVWSLFGLEPHAGPRWARSLFFASLPYLVLVLGALVVSES